MLHIRPFQNTDPVVALKLWNENARSFPTHYYPIQHDILESQIFGNVLFDHQGFLLAFNGTQPAGFIHASFGPNDEGDDLSKTSGMIFAPVISPNCENSGYVAKELIMAAEHYLQKNGATHWYAGGAGKVSPFYTGLYSRTSPFGVFEDDQFTLSAFEELGYRVCRRSSRLRLDVNSYRPPINQMLVEAHRKFIVKRTPKWLARNRWDANIYRNFSSFEWNVYSRNDRSLYPEAIAGAVVHQMLVPSVFLQNQFCSLAYIGVQDDYLRHGLGSVLLSSLANDLKYDNYLPLTLEASFPDDCESLQHFFQVHCFERIGGYVALGKMTTAYSIKAE